MKFLIFSDLHYAPGVLYGASRDSLRLIQQRAEENHCDFIIHAGDICYGPGPIEDFVREYNDFHIPSYHCLGNHDCDKTPLEDTLRLYNMKEGYYYFDCKGYRIIVADTNYFLEDGVYTHNNLRNQYDHPATQDHLPVQQLEWMRGVIEASPFPCLIISHASFEREVIIPKDEAEMIQLSHEANACKNAADVRSMIREINEKQHGKVLMVMNGHHHHDFLRILDNVLYWDINTTAYDWVCDTPHDKFPKEITDEYRLANHTIVFESPLTAVVTLEGSAITIEGSESTCYKGVTREMVGDYVLDRSGRPTTAKIQSAKLMLL